MDNKAISRQCILSRISNWLSPSGCPCTVILTKNMATRPNLNWLSRANEFLQPYLGSVKTTLSLPGLTITRPSALTHIGIGALRRPTNTMLFIQSAGGFFLSFILSRFLLLQHSPTEAEILLCCIAITILWLLRLIVQRMGNENALAA